MSGDASAKPSEPEAGEDLDGVESGDASTSSQPATPKPRKILYRMTPDGLVVEIEGVRFEPRVEPVRIRGGWGVDVTVEATATDERMHRLLSPEKGPLAFAARIERKGTTERFVDDRSGDDEQYVVPGSPTTLARRFPGPGESPLWWGQELTLEAGLWGLAADDGRRRPVRKLFVVKMVAGNKPQPIITPPE